MTRWNNFARRWAWRTVVGIPGCLLISGNGLAALMLWPKVDRRAAGVHRCSGPPHLRWAAAATSPSTHNSGRATAVLEWKSTRFLQALHESAQHRANAMSLPTRTLPHIRQASTAGFNLNASSSGQSAALQARVDEKKAELDHLRQLRDLSAAMAMQMEALQQKLSTLADGTEGAVVYMQDCVGMAAGILIALTPLQQLRLCSPTGTMYCVPSIWRLVRLAPHRRH
jgi:hypothetical protein